MIRTLRKKENTEIILKLWKCGFGEVKLESSWVQYKSSLEVVIVLSKSRSVINALEKRERSSMDTYIDSLNLYGPN